MHIAQAWIPVVSGLVGAAGAVTAQAVSASSSSRRENAAAAARRRDAKASAFADEKRDLFVRTLKTYDEQVKAYEDLSDKVDNGEAAVTIPTNAYSYDRWGTLAAELDLLAPDVVKILNPLLKEFMELDVSISLAHQDMAKGHVKNLRHDRKNLRDAMRLSLNVDDPPEPASDDRQVPLAMALTVLALLLLLWAASLLA